MNIAPKPRFLYSVRAASGNIVKLCSEAVDNSFDAQARHITIKITPDEIKFEDDGIGVRAEKFPALFTLGDHVQLTSTTLGRFGVGITAQAINTANIMRVRSVSVDGCYRATADWREVVRHGWNIPDPDCVLTAAGTPTGTEISLTGLQPVRGYSVERVLNDLAERFFPALAEGRTISVNGIPVPLLATPAMTDVVEATFLFDEGRSASLRAGILPAPSRLNRVHVSFGHRVIMPASLLGCGKSTGLTQMFARVQLGGQNWKLGAFKDELSNAEQVEELEEEVAKALAPILQKCSSASISTRIATMSKLVNDLLPAELSAARPHHKGKKDPAAKKRPRGSSQGFVDPDKSDPDGPAKTKPRLSDGLLITFDGIDEECGWGFFEPGSRARPNRVNMSPDNYEISQLIQHRDERIGALAIACLATTIFEEGRAQYYPQGELQFEKFGVRLAKLLRASEYGKPNALEAG